MTKIAFSQFKKDLKFPFRPYHIAIIGGRPVNIHLEDKKGQDRDCPDKD